MLSRSGPIARKGPLRPRSASLCASKRAQRREYGKAAGETPFCQACGSNQHLDNSHHFPQGRYPEHRNNPLNFWLECRRCHDLYEHNKSGYAERFPDAWTEKWRLMQLVDARAAAFFEMKNPTLFPLT